VTVYFFSLFASHAGAMRLVAAILGIVVKWIRIALIGVLCAGSALHSYCLFHEANEDISESVSAKLPSDKPPPNKETASELLRQSTEFQGWAILVLGAITAVVTTTKVHSRSFPEWTFILFGPAIVYLASSFLMAWQLKKRYNYLLLKNNFEDLMSLASYLEVQFKCFAWAIGLLALFAASFLCLILIGRVKPDEERKPHQAAKSYQQWRTPTFSLHSSWHCTLNPHRMAAGISRA
jgi:hypothetical protein